MLHALTLLVIFLKNLILLKLFQNPIYT